MSHPLLAHITTRTDDLTELSILGQAVSLLLNTESAEDIIRMLEDSEIQKKIESATFELTTEMTFRLRDGKYCFSYDESTLTGMEGTRTEISFSPESPELIFITRSGNVISTLVLEQNRRHVCSYQTPMMPFELVVVASTARNTLTPRGGRLDLDYFIEIRGAAMQRIRLSLDARPYGEEEGPHDGI